VYVSNAFHAGGDFVFRTNFYEPFLKDDSKTLIDYLGMDKMEKKVYDKKVQDLLVSILMIEGCKSQPLRDHLKNQYLTGNVECYPKVASKASEMIDNFVSDNAVATPAKNWDWNNKDRRYKKQDEAVAGAHVHQDKDTARVTKALVLAAVADDGIIHRNAFKPIASREEFEDEDMGEVACIIVGDHYYPSDDESMNGESTSDEDKVSGPLAIVLIDGQDDSNYETGDESMDFDDEFSYDDSIRSNELPSLCSRHSSSSSECSTVANGDIQTVICETSYVCDTDEDSSAATFISHDDTVIDNRGDLNVLLNSGSTVNITTTRVPLKMEQSVRRYLDDIILGIPRSMSIGERPSRNVAHMINVRQRFSGSVEDIP
jgi:hypothetical protein